MDKSPARASGWHLACGMTVHGAISALLLLLGAGVALGLFHTAGDVFALARQSTDEGVAARWGAAALLVLATFAGAWWLGRRARPLPPLFFLIGLIVVTLALRAALIATVDPAWSTDYLRYWQRAVEMAASGQFSASNIYQQRALLVPYPVELLFGPDATTALKWTNVLLLLMLQLAAYDMMRLSTNHQAAQAASLVLLASPLPAYAALIPSHDLWSLAFLAGAAWAAVRTWRLPPGSVTRLLCVASLGILCGCFAYALELQRSTGLLFCIALLLASVLYLLSTRTCRMRRLESHGVALLVVATLALALQPVIGAGVEASRLHTSVSDRAQTAMAMKYAAHGSAMGTGRSAWYARFNDRFREKSIEGPEVAGEFASSVVLSTWILQPTGKLDAVREHAGRLFSLSYPPDWDTLLRQPAGMSKEGRAALITHIGIFGLALLGATLAALLFLCFHTQQVSFPVLLGMIFVIGLALVMLLLFENKPFNIAPVWLLYPLVLGSFAARIAYAEAPPARTASTKVAVARSICGTGMLIVGSLGAWLLLRSMYGPDDGLVLDRWHLQLTQGAASPTGWEEQLEETTPRAFEPQYYIHDRRSFVLRDAPEDGQRIQSRADHLYLILQLPPGPISKGDTLVASRDVCLDGTSASFEFFMFAPYARRGVKEAFSVNVEVDGNSVKRLPIPHRDRSNTMHLVSIPNTFEGSDKCYPVAFSLISHVNRNADSWSRASHVEIWLPRAVN